MSCILKAYGGDFHVDRFLEASELHSCAVFRRGEPRFPASNPQGEVHVVSGLHFRVSDSDFDNLRDQIQDAISFIKQHKRDLEQLLKFPGIENAFLDFGINKRDFAIQSDDFPAELLFLAGSLGIGIRTSQFAVGS